MEKIATALDVDPMEIAEFERAIEVPRGPAGLNLDIDTHSLVSADNGLRREPSPATGTS